MTNMSYCRFENTLRDLKDCHENLDATDLDEAEEYARKDLVELCMQIVKDWNLSCESGKEVE